MMATRVINRIASDILRLLRDIRSDPFDADLLGDSLELLDRGRAIHIGTDHSHFLFARLASVLYMVALRQPPRELASRRGFTCTLQTSHQNNRRRLHGQRQLTRVGA